MEGMKKNEKSILVCVRLKVDKSVRWMEGYGIIVENN